MAHYLLILMGSILVNNFVLIRFLGLCPFLGVSKKQESALGMGVATTFVLTLASLMGYLLDTYLLRPFEAEYLKIVVFIVLIAVVVQFTEMFVRKTNPLLHQTFGIFLPLITTNCAVLGVVLLNVQQNIGFIESILQGFGAAIGFTLVLVLFAGIRERIDQADVPKPFRGQAIALITAGIAAMAFMGFAGLVRV